MEDRTDELLVDTVLMLERLQACSLGELNDVEGNLWPDIEHLVDRARRKLDPPLAKTHRGSPRQTRIAPH